MKGNYLSQLVRYLLLRLKSIYGPKHNLIKYSNKTEQLKIRYLVFTPLQQLTMFLQIIIFLTGVLYVVHWMRLKVFKNVRVKSYISNKGFKGFKYYKLTIMVM